MPAKPLLIVDDEKNIRLTLSMALDGLGMPVDTAASGEEALEKLAARFYGVMLLDLRLPGLDGMEVLRRVSARFPEIKVIVITAYGSIDLAVEAMKLGAVDFLEKPFNPAEVRATVDRIFQEAREDRKEGQYDTYMERAMTRISEGRFEAALVYAHKALSLNPDRPEAFNFLGGLCEIRGNRREGEKNYRVALTLDPTYEPARSNFERITTRPYTQLGIVWD